MIEAANLLKELAEEYPELEGHNFVIMLADLPKPVAANGYEIAIRTNNKKMDEKILEKLRATAAKNNLKITQTETATMIYEELSQERLILIH